MLLKALGIFLFSIREGISFPISQIAIWRFNASTVHLDGSVMHTPQAGLRPFSFVFLSLVFFLKKRHRNSNLKFNPCIVRLHTTIWFDLILVIWLGTAFFMLLLFMADTQKHISIYLVSTIIIFFWCFCSYKQLKEIHKQWCFNVYKWMVGPLKSIAFRKQKKLF